ncbi:MAG TPA: GNAT family N-acetyltransferase [Mycobacteriales bacterium]|nr:GNAT family N-acetyltransferase [Mycobacteriales bacterium]
MYRRLGSGTLKGTDPMEIGYVEGPDAAWMSRLVPFLGHKEPWYEYHIGQALSEPLDDLRTRFYLGLVGDLIVSHVMVVSARGIGILGHVYTLPEWRRQGASSLLMDALMRDVADLSLDVVTLSTEFGSAAYGIYAQFGFRSLSEGSGDMAWRSEAARDHFALAGCEIRPVQWSDWPAYSWATLQPVGAVEPRPRSAALGVSGQGSSEGPFLLMMQSALGGRSSHRVLRSATGAVVGWCHLVPGQFPLSRARILDVHVLSGFESHLPALLRAMEWPAEPVACALTPAAPEYVDALAAHGFARSERLNAAAADLGSPPGLEVFLRVP